MRKNIFLPIFILTIIVSNIQGQNYHPLPDSNVIWITELYQGVSIPNSYFIDFTGPDTIINSLKYRQLFCTEGSHVLPQPLTGDYEGAYRNDTNGKVFVVPANSIQEYCLYDFSKVPGDTIKNIPVVYFCPIYISMFRNGIVDSVKFDTLGTRTLKKMYLTITGLGNQIWMEWVGSQHGGFAPCDFDTEGLFCMSYNDTIYYQGSYHSFLGLEYDYIYSPGKCDTIVVSEINEINNNKGFQIYPNPANEKIMINNFDYQNHDISIFNLFGECEIGRAHV